MKTKQELVTGEVSVWAIPKATYELEALQPGEQPFYYALRTDAPWQQGAVKVYSETLSMVVPEGIDLVSKAVLTLEMAMEERTKSYQYDMEQLRLQINKLLLLEHQA